MADLFLNFKDFQHEHTDDKSTTLKHKKLGHKITLAHNVLSDKNKQALMAMAKSAKESRTSDQANEAEDQDSGYGKVIRKADGGEAKPLERRRDDNSDTPPPKQKTQTETLHDIGQGAQQGTKIPNAGTLWNRITHPLANGGQVEQAPNGDVPQPFAEGTPDQTVQPEAQSGSPTSNLPDDGTASKIGEMIGSYAKKHLIDPVTALYHLTGKGQPGDIVGKAADTAADFGKGALKGAGVELPQAAPEPLPLKQEDIPQPAQQAQATPNQGLAPAPITPAPQDDPSKNYLGSMTDAQTMRMKAADDAAKAEGNLGKENIAQRNETWGEQQLAQSAFDDSVKEIDRHVGELEQDVKNGHINPDKYWTGTKNPQTGQVEGGHSKVMAGIGMILAGFNPTNSPNAAINFLKYQMDKNIEGQKENLNAKGNLLHTMMQQYGNVKDGLTASRLILADDLANRLGSAADAAKLPQAKAQALDAKGKIIAEFAPMRRQLEMSQALMKAANSGHPHAAGAIEHLLNQEAQFDPERFKLHSAAFVPGVGMSTSLSPISETVRAKIVDSKNTNDLFNNALQMARTPIPNPVTHPMEYRKFAAVADTLRNQMIGTIKQQQHDGVYKESEADFLIKQIGDTPASIFRSITSVPKLQEMQRIKQNEYKNLLDSVGIKSAPLPSFNNAVSPGSTQSQGHPEGFIMENDKGQRIIKKNGKWVPVTQ